MNETLARAIITGMLPGFAQYHPAVQESCIAGFILGEQYGWDRAIKSNDQVKAIQDLLSKQSPIPFK